ncbi:MAG: anthrone oxygenase family protein [Pseudonocardiaceae bacterium]
MLTIVAAGLHLPVAVRAALPWIVAALVLNGVGFVLTVRMNVPLNDALAAAGSPDRIADLAQVRASFEAAWIRWNIARAVAFTAAFGCLTWALTIYGRTRAGA